MAGSRTSVLMQIVLLAMNQATREAKRNRVALRDAQESLSLIAKLNAVQMLSSGGSGIIDVEKGRVVDI